MTFFSHLKRFCQGLDVVVILATIFLTIIGLSSVYSITSVLEYNNDYGNPFHYVHRQTLGVLLGVMGIFILLLIPFSLMKRLSAFLPCVNLGLLVMVLIIGGGPSNVKSWIDIGPLSIQPAELVKIGLVLSIAWFVSTHRRYFHHLTWRRLFTLWCQPTLLSYKLSKYLISPWGVLAYTAVILLLIMKQPDLGTGLIIVGTGILMVFCSGLQFKTLGQLFLVLSLMFSGVWVGKDYVLEPHQLERFVIWEDPFVDASDLGYQNIGGYTAIALGGLYGVGSQKSIQKYGFVVEPHNDFIVSIIAEEYGTLCVFAILIAYFLIFLRMVSRSFHTDDVFASLVCLGLAFAFGLQVVVNMGGVSGTIPLTGVTLPFVSYGGTSMLTTYLLLGVYFNVNKYIRQHPKQATLNGTKREVTSHA